jgi:hypothetical protein
MMSVHLSLLGTIVVAYDIYPLLLCYHCSDTIVAMGQLSVATVAYDPLLHCLFVVVTAICGLHCDRAPVNIL